ncbi:hypothetical protein OG215_40680 (plasmid) [Streptomyces globisporus]|uniref:hypothetical protein n=1 Tax=Streptomyces globisporus TaxID=1908 RepID=UPI002F90C66E|nr:hypothetical protein OG215_40680 [Streptomyces globisporus]
MFQTRFVSMYPWVTDELGEVHGGQPGVVNADGSEPGPVTIMSTSGGGVGTLTEWWAYDGRIEGPAATDLRGSCSCGWRGETLYPVDWDQAHGRQPYEYDTSGPERDWLQHTEEVEATLVPLPDDLAALLVQVNERLDTLSSSEPLAVLRAANILQRHTQMSLQTAASSIERNRTTPAAVAAAIGCSPSQAKDRLRSYH